MINLGHKRFSHRVINLAEGGYISYRAEPTAITDISSLAEALLLSLSNMGAESGEIKKGN